MYIKNFDAWNAVKKRTDAERRGVRIREGEVRWAALGVNVGSEIDGKGVSFTRPVLVLHVVGQTLALVVPLSTKRKDIPGYIPFDLRGREVSLCVHQARTLSQHRILSRIGKISQRRLADAKREFAAFFGL